jgi:hypothetical protein
MLAAQHQDMFPLHVWMTGSGTQFNMKVNGPAATFAGGQYFRGELSAIRIPSLLILSGTKRGYAVALSAEGD